MAFQEPLIPPSPSQEWLSPPRLADTYPAAGAEGEAPPPMYELRPLTTSEVLDRTFSIYRSNFWLFAGIASFSGMLQSVIAGMQMLFQGRVMASAQQIPGTHIPVAPIGTAVPIIIGSIAGVIYFLAYTVTNSACVFALGETYLGRRTSITDAFRATIGRWYSYIGIAFWQAVSFMWLPIVVTIPGIILLTLGAARSSALAVVGGILTFGGFTAGLVIGFIFYLRNSFGVPIAVLEQMPVRRAMRRSKALSDGAKWRMVLVLLITYALFMVVGILQMPLLFLTLMAITKGGHAYVAQAITLVLNFVGHTVVTPVVMIGISLLYFDQRVRKEAFDIVFLMGEEEALKSNAAAPQQLADVQQGPTQAVDAPTI